MSASPSFNRREFMKLAALLSASQLPMIQLLGRPRNPARTAGQNVLILVFDALSARHISLYGYQRETMPNLARFAERAVVFHNHRSPANFTSPATASLLTGTYPWTHRAIQLQGTPLPGFADRNIFSAFSEAGYHQVAFSHNPLAVSILLEFRESLSRFVPTRELCLSDSQVSDLLLPNDWTNSFQAEWEYLRGGEFPPGSLFISWLHRALRAMEKRRVTAQLGARFPRGVPSNFNAYFILEDAIDWIQGQLTSLQQPFLNYVHLLPPHDPYTPPREFINIYRDEFRPDTKAKHALAGRGVPPDELQRGRRDYDEYIAYADAEFGRLVDFMQSNGVLENTIVVFTADHGEAFERGVLGHLTPLLYEPLLNIPLLISTPGRRAREDVFERTNAVDVLPTLLHAAGHPVPHWTEGRVLPPFADRAQAGAEYAVEAKSNPKRAPLTRKATVALVRDDAKLIRYIGYPEIDPPFEMYDLAEDPEELENLYPSVGSLAGSLREEMETKLEEVDLPFNAP